MSSIEHQVGGSHYLRPFQPIEYIVANDIPFREGNVIKYVSRHQEKGGAEDIRKAIHYLEMILEDYDGTYRPTLVEAEEQEDEYYRPQWDTVHFNGEKRCAEALCLRSPREGREMWSSNTVDALGYMYGRFE